VRLPNEPDDVLVDVTLALEVTCEPDKVLVVALQQVRLPNKPDDVLGDVTLACEVTVTK
jgi:hypothetical protein